MFYACVIVIWTQILLTRLRKLIKLQIDECMAETGEFILTVQCHAPLVTFRNGELPDR